MVTIIPSNFYTLDGTDSHADPSNPLFRKINFEHEAAVRLVSTELRRAWTALPPPGDRDSKSEISAVQDFIRANRDKTPEELAAMAIASSNPDTQSIHTSWRDAVYDQWNNVLYDVGKFLPEICPGDLCHRPPDCELFALEFHGDDVVRVWDQDVLLIPAFLKPGVSIRVKILQQRQQDEVAPDEGIPDEAGSDPASSAPAPFDCDSTENLSTGRRVVLPDVEVGVFDASNPCEIWYIKQGTSVCFHVDIGGETGAKGLAAVIMYGPLYEMNDDEREWREIESSRVSAMKTAGLM
ncbi:MAG: hypothetical protein Q9172_001139 [Xanthocarpia lactea]